MLLTTRYAGRSGVVNVLDRARVAFATNVLRESVAFEGAVAQPLLFREALAALYHIVVSDFKYRPKDRVAFKAWLEEQDRKFVATLGITTAKARQQLELTEARLGELNRTRAERLRPFHKARLEFFNYMYEQKYDLTMLYDPVITVHPDEVSFEAFSRDESSYARLGAKFDLFENVREFACGTTNIDFSTRLHGELERMRAYRDTRFTINPHGFTAVTDGAGHHEKKIDLPESWVKGFLQVHSTMAMGLTKLTLAPVDLFNLIRALRRRKPRSSPRALRYELTPGQPGRAVLEPWEDVIELTGMPKYDGPKAVNFRTWGRQRLTTIARLLPAARSVDLYLAGFGLPSIYVVNLGPLTFTLALSGWTDNDWTGGTQKFDLLTRRIHARADEVMQVYHTLREKRSATDAALATVTGFGIEKCRSAASHLCQVGRGMYDLAGGVFRFRDLFGKPFTLKDAAAAVQPSAEATTPTEIAAKNTFESGAVSIISRRPVPDGHKLSGNAQGSDGMRVRPRLHVASDGRIIEADCTCKHYQKHKLTQGPCEHILALRLAHMSQLQKEDEGQG